MTSTANPSTVALAEKYAREHFGLSLPLSPETLKGAFRKRAKELHTDTSRDQDTRDAFIAMKDAYDFLVNLEGMEFVYGERAGSENINFKTVDGTPLYELGLGLGPMKNGRDCERCGHKGYTEREDFDRLFSVEDCPHCNSTGRIRGFVICSACYGTGLFRQRRSGRTVICRVCGGSGTKFSSSATCPTCEGVRRRSRGASFIRCYKCDGTGEIELFSPLFPKGRIMNGARAR
jgi:DnaJ-class molecular chaperone